MASQREPSNIKGISMIADGINHAVPTQNELKFATNWLLQQKLVNAEAKKYHLTKTGLTMFASAQIDRNSVLSIWENLEIQLQNF